MALDCPLKDIVSHAELASEHIKTLEELGGLSNQGKDLYEELQTVSWEGELFKAFSRVFMYVNQTVAMCTHNSAEMSHQYIGRTFVDS